MERRLNGAGTKGQDDIVTWEYILGGKAVQSTHSINDGAYGGRTIYFYSKADNRHFYHYFTNAGFHSTGTLKFDGDQVTAEETVLGFPGLTDVKATIRFTDAGWETASTYLQNGEWVQGMGSAILPHLTRRLFFDLLISEITAQCHARVIPD